MTDETFIFPFFILTSFYYQKRISRNILWYMNRCIDHFDSGDELYIRSIFEEALMICMFCSFIKCKRLVVRKMSIKRMKDIMSSITYIKRKERWITFLNTLSNKNTAVQLNLPRYVCPPGREHSFF
jgi:hypothetical protein